jgi:hypothetical protein
MLLDAADYAVIAPLSTSRLHAFAYLADVLSPLYNFGAISGLVLKRRAGPYYPELQWELDCLVGQGLVEVTQLSPVIEARAFLDASFGLRRSASDAILSVAQAEQENLVLRDFLRELAEALACVPEGDLDAAVNSDVTWDTAHSGTVIDYAEWRAKNYTQLAADRVNDVAREAVGAEALTLTPGAKVNLYVRYLRKVANG